MTSKYCSNLKSDWKGSSVRVEICFSCIFSQKAVCYTDLGGCTELCKRDLGLVLLDLFSVRLLIIFCGVADVNVANSAFNLQDGQFKNTLQLGKCDLGDRKK